MEQLSSYSESADVDRVARALRFLQEGITKALAALEEVPPESSAQRWVHVYSEIPEAGLTLDQLRALLGKYGFDSRSIGGLVRYGNLTREQGKSYGDSSTRYWKTAKAPGMNPQP